jgi:pseudouridine-5'-phosphate glycosidase
MKIALESTLITHGFSHPKNIEVALLLEDTARSLGCQPQTIAVLDGQIRVGLTEAEIRELASREGVTKAGVRELPLVLASKGYASTTVSATMRIAHNSGIPVFATGGIGGVHPGDWDVSQDILELSRTGMVVVSAGPKAILDLRGTHEMLETYGVTVVGYQTDEMPAFYSRSAGIPISRVNSPQEIVQIYKAAQELKLPGAVLVFNPIPPDYEIPESQIEIWRDQSLADLRDEGVSGKEVTPFLLSKMAEHSQGRTIDSNIQLLKNNVILGCQIALEFNRLAA